MNLIFIEAKNAHTSECNFLKAVLSKHFVDKSVEFICMDGVGNLFQKSIINRMEQAQDEGDSVLVLVDADSPSKGWGYTKRHDDIEAKKTELQLNFPLFIYPNNNDDGDVEVLMEVLSAKICIKIGGTALRTMKHVFKEQRILKTIKNTICLIVKQSSILISLRSS